MKNLMLPIFLPAVLLAGCVHYTTQSQDVISACGQLEEYYTLKSGLNISQQCLNTKQRYVSERKLRCPFNSSIKWDLEYPSTLEKFIPKKWVGDTAISCSLEANLIEIKKNKEEKIQQEKEKAIEKENARLRSIKNKPVKKVPITVTTWETTNGGKYIEIQSKYDGILLQNMTINRGNCIIIKEHRFGVPSRILRTIDPVFLRFGYSSIWKTTCSPIEAVVKTDIGTFQFKF